MAMVATSLAVQTLRAGDAGRGWELHTRDPDSRLRDVVVGAYQGYREWGGAIERRALPALVVPMILSFGPRWWISDPGRSGGTPAVRRSFVAGVHDAYATNASMGEADGMQVNLTPFGAAAIFGRPLHELTGRVVDLEDLLGPDAARMEEALALEPNWERRFARLDGILLRALGRVTGERGRGSLASPDVARAWVRLVGSDGRVRVDELAREVGCSRKHLGVRFREQVGLSPGRAGRVLRFARAVALLSDPTLRIGEIALACGYYDQAHLNRDFRAMGGTAPTTLRAQQMPYGGIELAEVPSVQDAGSGAA